MNRKKERKITVGCLRGVAVDQVCSSRSGRDQYNLTCVLGWHIECSAMSQ